MHAHVMKAAKKKALSALIQHMRKMELKGMGGDDEGAPKGPVDMSAEDNDVMEPDMSDLEDMEGAAGEEEEGGGEDDPKAELEQFMKKGGHKPHKSRASVVMAIRESPAGKMRKTFGGK